MRVWLVLAAVVGAFWVGHSYGTYQAAAEAGRRLEAAQTKAADISTRYAAVQNDLDKLYADNQRLAERLRLASTNAKAARCTPQSASSSNIPAGVAGDFAQLVTRINELTYRADQAANYATKCHEWIVTQQR